MGGSWGNVQDQNNSCKARPDVEEDGRVRGMDLGGSSIFVKIVEYVNSNARSDVEEGGRNGSGRLLWPPLSLSLSPVEWTDGCRRGRNQSPRPKLRENPGIKANSRLRLGLRLRPRLKASNNLEA